MIDGLPSGTVLFQTYEDHRAGLAGFDTATNEDVELPAAGPATGFAISPQGHRIAFNLTEFVADSSLVVLSLEDGSTAKIVRGLGGLNAPAWSPVTDEILFATGAGDIYSVRPDGAELTLLLADMGAIETDWSPEGDEFVFSSHTGNVWVFSLSDGSTRKVWERARGFGSWPSWSPTGLEIAIQVVDPETQLVEIQLVPVSGEGHAVELSVGRDVFQPSWTPDGRFLIVSGDTDDGKSQDIYAIRVDDGELILLGGTPAEDSVPQFIGA